VALIVAGVSHATASIDVREKLAFNSREALDALSSMREDGVLREGVILSTCNRTEIYAVADDERVLDRIESLYSERLGEDVGQYLYVRREREATAHLFSVAAGLESMILGEAQIHGQVKEAWEQSRSQSGPILNRMFQSALLAGSRAREETGIGRSAASVSSAAVQLSKKIFGGLSGRRAMVLGAGDVAEIALECLLSEGVRVAIVANRTHERARSLAERHGATAMHYDQCWESLRDVDSVARYGGEEFFVLMPETTADEAADLAKRVRAALARQRPPAGAVTLSFGVASYPAHGLNGEALIGAADEALYEAKNGGRDRVVAARTAARVKAARG